MRPQRGKTPKKRSPADNNAQCDPVEVYCRLRPLDPNEPVSVKAISPTEVQLVPPDTVAPRNGQLKEFQYSFQYVFDEYASQKAIFDHVALPLVEDLLRGKNGLLFAYGITGSGKSHTMTGTPDDQGVLPRCLDVLFNSIGGLQAKKYVFKPDKLNGFDVQTEADAMLERQNKEILPGIQTPRTPRPGAKLDGDGARVRETSRVGDVDEDSSYAVFVSFTEIYNNYVYDLLEDLVYDPILGYKPPQSKILRTDGQDSMYVHNCIEVEVKTPEEAFEVFYKGKKRRKVAHTALNAESSRSHSVFNIRLVQAPLDSRGEEVIQDKDKVFVSQLSLVDLAGSERTNRTKNSGDRLKEAGNINQSLMVLRNCIEILRENQKTGGNKMVPYRDSKITHLFKTFFEGEGRIRMIVCINPGAAEYEETIHVMKFAELTQEVLITRAQAAPLDVGLTPGRRRLNQQLREARQEEMAVPPPIPPIIIDLGPPLPNLQLLGADDNKTLVLLSNALDDRLARRQAAQAEIQRQESAFRARLVEFEREFDRRGNQLRELERLAEQREKDAARCESRYKTAEKRLEEMKRKLSVLEKENQTLSMQLQDKSWKVQQERSEKERLKSDFRNRLDLNNQQWEKNLERARRQYEEETDQQIQEREDKLNMVKRIIAEDKTRSRPYPKPRTQTTPAVLMAARSEPDITRIATPRPLRTPASNLRSATRATPSSARLPDMSALNTFRTPAPRSASTRTAPPVALRKQHRRSKSAGDNWLDHNPDGPVMLDTVLQPKMTKKRSVSKLEVRDTKEHNRYCLTTQDQDSDGQVSTKLIKGDILRTPGGGAAVVFNDVEELRKKSPGSKKRRSPSARPEDYEGEWTDTEDRCNIAIEGHGLKRVKRTDV